MKTTHCIDYRNALNRIHTGQGLSPGKFFVDDLDGVGTIGFCDSTGETQTVTVLGNEKQATDIANAFNRTLSITTARRLVSVFAYGSED